MRGFILGAAGAFLLAKTVTAQTANEAPIALDTIDVVATGVPDPRRATALPSPYAGGQVGSGARLGLLGNRDTLSTPFNLTGYTAELAANQQARSVADIAANDPSVRATVPRSGARDIFSIRGFSFPSYNIAFDGLFGMLPKQRVVPEIAERIEILKGPDTFVNGVSLGGSVGGAINLVPKRATDAPITRVGVGYASSMQPWAHLDLGRRFGPAGAFGVRVNGVLRKGEVPIDKQSEAIGTFAAGLDYRGERLRLSLDAGYQRQEVKRPDWVLTLAPSTLRPPVPRSTTNLSQPWASTTSEDRFAVVQGEYDLTDNWTIYAKGGLASTKTDGLLATPTMLRSNGDFTVERFYFPSAGDHASGEAGVRGRFETGPLRHDVAFSASAWRQELTAAGNRLGSFPSNIFAPVIGPPPSFAGVPRLGELKKTASHLFTSLAVADTISALDERVLLTLGGRYQKIDSESFDGISGLRTGRYDKGAFTPAVGVVLKLAPNISLYGNYVEALQQGPKVPIDAVNYGQIFPPTVSRQIEAGVKADWGGWTTTLSAFRINQAYGSRDPRTAIYSVDAEQRNQGVELNVFGEPLSGFRVLGGVALIDGRVTAGTNFQGNRPVGVPDYQANLGVEWDAPFLPGLTLSGRLIHTAAQFVDAANRQSIPAWTRVDIGARYVLRRDGVGPITLRANVENLFDESYYASASAGQVNGISRGAGRTMLLSSTFEF